MTGMSPPLHYDGVLCHLQGSPKHVSEQQPQLASSFLVVPTLSAALSGPPVSPVCPLVLSQTPSSNKYSSPLASNLPAAP